MAQTNYSPGLLPSLPGMLADLNPLVGSVRTLSGHVYIRT